MTNCICFFNPHSFGDTFFSSPFIRHICEMNPTRTFYYFISKGEHIFTENPIPNLHNFTTCILENDEEQYQHAFYMIRWRQQQRLFEYTVVDKTFIFFNMWCHALSCNDLEVDGLRNGFVTSLQIINNDYSETYNASVTPDDKIMPIVNIPDKQIYIENGFTNWLSDWRTANNSSNPPKKLVFMFNFFLITFKTPPYKIDEHIVYNANKCRNTHTFIVPSYKPEFKDIPNIVCCDRMFQYSEADKSYKNVFLLETIIRECDIIISQYSGGSWIWFNQHIIHHYASAGGGANSAHTIPIYLTHPKLENDYATKMNIWIKKYYQTIYKDSPERLNDYRDVVKFIEVYNIPSMLTS